MKIQKLTLLLAIVLLTQGCASTNLKRNPKISLALQIMEAADRSNGLQDIDKVELDELLKKNQKMDFLYLVEAGAYALDYFKPVSGITQSTSINMALLRFFLSGGRKIGEVSQLLVWMPEDMAEDRVDAQIKMGRILEKAAIQALPKGYSTNSFEWTDKAILGALSNNRVIRVNGDSCPGWSCVLTGTIPTKTHLRSRGKMKEIAIPAFISGGLGQGYGYQKNSGWPGISIRRITKEYDETGSRGAHWHRLKTEALNDFDHKAWYLRLSKNLPNWAYYLQMTDPYDPKKVIFPVPVILNQGKPLLFVKPS